MTIGDVLAVVAAVALIGVCWGATLILTALAFPARAARSAEAIVAAPGKCLLRGLGIFVGVGLAVVVLHGSHAGPVRIVGWALCVGLLLVALVGGAGIARLLGERIQGVGTNMSPFASVTRGAALCVLAGLLPVVGWLVVLPIATFLALGGASIGLRRQTASHPVEASTSHAPSPLIVGDAS